MSDPWAIMPFLNAPEMTWTAVEDLLAQSLSGVRVLLVDQGAAQEDRDWIDAAIDRESQKAPPPFDADPDYKAIGKLPRVLCWHYLPMLPSLSAVWNRALDFVWELGGTEALVVNNDVRLHRETYNLLLGVRTGSPALFVSAVGVREGQFDPEASMIVEWGPGQQGGPDFSCFLLSKEGHERYRFDEQFRPAFFEDLDAHRRYMLGGDGQRIFSVNLPFLHYSSQTIKQMPTEQRLRFNTQHAASQAYYVAKWGGPVNAETFWTPFERGTPPDWAEQIPAPTTPDLQRYWLRPTDAPA